MFGTRWRWNASRALAVLRYAAREEGARRSSSACARTICSAPSSPRRSPARTTRPAAPSRCPDHPLVRQTVRDCLTEAMDVERLRGHPRADGARRDPPARARHAPSRRPSRTRSSTPSRTPSSTTRRSRSAARGPCRCAARCPSTSATSARSTPTRSRSVVAEARPEPRDADELHDALLGLVARAGRGRRGADGSTSWRAQDARRRWGTRLRVGERADVRGPLLRRAEAHAPAAPRGPGPDARRGAARGGARARRGERAVHVRGARRAARPGGVGDRLGGRAPRERGRRPARAVHAGRRRSPRCATGASSRASTG